MGKLTIQEIASILVEKNGFVKKDAKEFVSAMFALIQERLETDNQVKIRGLGTFKIINVEPRESVSVQTGERVVINGHSKVSFTPDATMKELVNKPFSQFETVILNDGVEFDDLKENTDDETSNEDEKSVEESLINDNENLVAVEVKTVEPVEAQESIIEHEFNEEHSPVIDQKEVAAQIITETHSQILSVEEVSLQEPEIQIPKQEIPTTEPVKSQPVDIELKPRIETVEDEEEKRSWGWLKALAVLVLVALAAFGGYYYGIQQQDNITLIVRDTIIANPMDSSSTKGTTEKAESLVEETVSDTVSAKVEVSQVPVQSKPEAKPEKPAEESVDPWAHKDERVRLGAYRIIGLEREVTVLPGQTFYSICKAHLGPDMECYVEVYNDLPRSPKIKAGQIIKIPKLKVKKRRK